MRRLLAPYSRRLRPTSTPGPQFMPQVERDVFTERAVAAATGDTAPPVIVMSVLGAA